MKDREGNFLFLEGAERERVRKKEKHSTLKVFRPFGHTSL